MPVTTVADPRLDIDPVRIGAAVGITADTGAGYQLRDAYGVTYTGAPAHLAVSALARHDLTDGIYPDQPAVAPGIRATAATLIDWFTSPHVNRSTPPSSPRCRRCGCASWWSTCACTATPTRWARSAPSRCPTTPATCCTTRCPAPSTRCRG